MEQVQIFFLLECLVFIMLPFVLEKCLDSLLQIDVDWLHFVELLDGSEELGQVVPIIEVCIKLLECYQYLRKVAHNY